MLSPTHRSASMALQDIPWCLGGYIQPICQLCAVSFNIGRIRTGTEPESHGWDYSGGPVFEQDLHNTRNAIFPENSLCSIYPEDSGCRNIRVAHIDTCLHHVAGPGCVFEAGYSGHRITVEAMKGIDRARYIVRKPRNFPQQSVFATGANEEQSDEVDASEEFREEERYEATSKWFVTAQTVGVPWVNHNIMTHERYGVTCHKFKVENSPDYLSWNKWRLPDREASNYAAIPVHDACWKIFEKVSARRLGRVDIDGFVALWNRQACGNCGFENLMQDPAIRQCRKRWWEHKPGTEYLAANPVQIPGFKMSMRGLYKEEAPLGDGVFTARRYMKKESYTDAETATDPFFNSPSEIKNGILAHLCSKDIASLRLASRCFQQLPKALFKTLIRQEMPWFWEVDDLKIAQEEFLSQAVEEWDGNIDDLYPMALVFVNAPMARKHLDTNWLRIYEQLKLMEKGDLGVRNRARIWRNVEAIVGRIENMAKRIAFTGAKAGVDFPIWPGEGEGMLRFGISDPICLRCSPLV